MSDFLPKTEKRSLRYDFTARETHDLSMTLANKTRELNGLEEEKKSVGSQFTAKVNEAKATCNKLSNQIADGYEYRDVDCEVKYHEPQQGKKTIIRKDTNKVSAIETMTDYEWNLFNQPPDETGDGTGEETGTPKKTKKGKTGKKRGRKKNGGNTGKPVENIANGEEPGGDGDEQPGDGDNDGNGENNSENENPS